VGTATVRLPPDRVSSNPTLPVSGRDRFRFSEIRVRRPGGHRPEHCPRAPALRAAPVPCGRRRQHAVMLSVQPRIVANAALVFSANLGLFLSRRELAFPHRVVPALAQRCQRRGRAISP